MRDTTVEPQLMDRFTLLAPAVVIIAIYVLGFVAYWVLSATGRAPDLGEVKHNQVFGPRSSRVLAWLLRPIERVLVGRVSPNAVTALSLGFCALTGVAVAFGDLARASWLIAIAGFLDILDGRIARGSNQQTAAGALFDSVSDRWGELFVFGGYAWLLHDSPWLLAVIAAYGGSMMVSYTRARAEALGVSLAIGAMQRAERMVLIALGTFGAAWFGDTAIVVPILGVTMLACATLSTITACSRWYKAYRILVARQLVVQAPVVALKARPPLAEPRGSRSEAQPAQSANVATTGA